MSESSSEKGKGKGVHQGSTDNKGAHHNNVVTGNVSGYNVITGVLNVTIESATTLTDAIRDFTTRVATTSLRLKLVGDKVSTTSTVLTRISDLVMKQAKGENITTPKDEQNTASTDQGGKVGSASGDLDGGSDALKWQCFKDMREASQGAHSLFQHITQKINDASKTLPQLNGQNSGQLSRSKVELSDDERAKVFLRERDIDIMENEIESHKIELQLTFTVFQAVLNDDRIEGMKRIMLDMYKTMKGLVDDITQTSQNRTNPGIPGNKVGQSTDRSDPSTARPNLQPLNSLDSYRLVHIYMGWIFTKARPPRNYHDSIPTSRGPSWEFSVPVELPVSTEELYLMVLRQISQRSKLDTTLWDDYETLRKSRRKRVLLDNLLRDQNIILQREYPQLEWKLAGLAVTARRSAEELGTIQVILKTHHVPESQHGTPKISDRGQKSVGTAAGSVFAGEVRVSPGSGRGEATRSGSTNHARQDQNGVNGITDEPVYVQPYAPYRPQHGFTKGRQGAELHQPQLVFVKERKEGSQYKHVKEKSIHWWWPWSNRRGAQVYVELRGQGSRIKSRRHGNDSRSTTRVQLSSQVALDPSSPSTLQHTSAWNGQVNMPSGSGQGHERINNTRRNTYEMTPREEEAIVEELFDEWDAVVGRTKKGKRTRWYYGNDDVRGDDSSVGASRRLMRRVERESGVRIREEIRQKEQMRMVQIPPVVRVNGTTPRANERLRTVRRVEPEPPVIHITERHFGRYLTM
ncbi:hypothetical protein F5B22DRAFT_584657 [Xylaria bambusicola]|uniref:uncharacterized protein n=1 Tax=Xylaria bambusicola TaxID=326684 RepID=UPI002008A8C3|nr:uncharacterized protein F5B22DRAFT_584657 [Xylaria bambusicola]KAI0528331.1 hypothetical protein F5B22DRAFT_584657 [Xylaria bambusicola]